MSFFFIITKICGIVGNKNRFRNKKFLVQLTWELTYYFLKKYFLFSAKQMNVGWGSKETQFHGSEGKEAAKVKKNDVSFCKIVYFVKKIFFLN